MNRRNALKSIGAASAIGLVAPSALGATQKLLAKDKLAQYKALFDQALAKYPQLIGFAGTDKEYAKTALTVEGKLPQDLVGSFYRNGSALHERNNQRYQHLFEGDGMIQAFHFEDGKIHHQGKFVKTQKYQQEQKAGKFLYSGPDSHLNNSLPVSSSDMLNTANTSTLAVNNELWALWEAGSATALDPKSLETKGLVNLGDNSHLGDALKGLPFSAHPKVDPSGDIWNFGLSPTGHVVLYQLNSKGQVLNTKVINTGYKGGMLHDFLITHRSILLILPSIKQQQAGEGFFGRMTFDQSLPMKVMVINKQTLTPQRTIELEAGFAFHYGNAWEESDGTIHFDACLYPNLDILHHMNKLMKGYAFDHLAAAQTTIFTISPSGKTTKRTIGDNSEFPRITPHLTGLQNQFLYTLSSTQIDLWQDTVNRYDVHSGKTTSYVYGEDYLVEEHIWVDKKHKESGGYLIGTALHVPTKRTCLNIFEADHLANGPICRAWLPYHIPLGFHGNFIAKG